MKTVKEVSDLTGVSVRSLHYYDEIGLLKPSKITESGYRLYDEKELKSLQQILFFKELDIPLKDIIEIMKSPHFNKMQALENQKKLLMLKRDRLNNLIELVDKTLKGENDMSFKEFDMSEYFNVLENFKHENKDKVIEMWGSIEKFDEFIEKVKSKEAKIAKGAIKECGSIDKFTKSVENNLKNSDKIMKLSKQYEDFRRELLEDKNKKMTHLFQILVSYLGKDINSEEVRKVAEEITVTVKNDYEVFSGDNGNEYWYYMVKTFNVNPLWIKQVDKKYGKCSSKFIGSVLENCIGNNKPRAEVLFDNLVKDLSKDPCSKEIQQIVKEIDKEHRKSAEDFNMESSDNYIGYMSDLYLNNSGVISAIDKEYKSGASRFIGEAFKFYSNLGKK